MIFFDHNGKFVVVQVGEDKINVVYYFIEPDTIY